MLGERRDAYRVLVGKYEELRRIEKPRQRADNIKMNVQKIRLCELD